MANPTTNYGFVLPTPTDLVTDLPADFDVALQGVDTQMLTNANAAIAKTIVDAKGDIIAATAADAVSRLAVGANNTVLTADSTTGTGLKWAASGLTFITGATFTTVASVSLPTDTFTSTYDNYKIIFNITAAGAPITDTRMRLRAAGADNTTANYYSGGTEINFAGGGGGSNTNGGTFALWGTINTGTGSINSESTQFEITMMSPKLAQHTVFNVNGGKGSWTWKAMTAFFNAATAFDSMTLYGDAGTISGRYRVYGLQNS